MIDDAPGVDVRQGFQCHPVAFLYRWSRLLAAGRLISLTYLHGQ